MRFFCGSGERNKARRKMIGDVAIKRLSLNQLGVRLTVWVRAVSTGRTLGSILKYYRREKGLVPV